MYLNTKLWTPGMLQGSSPLLRKLAGRRAARSAGNRSGASPTPSYSMPGDGSGTPQPPSLLLSPPSGGAGGQTLGAAAERRPSLLLSPSPGSVGLPTPSSASGRPPRPPGSELGTAAMAPATPAAPGTAPATPAAAGQEAAQQDGGSVSGSQTGESPSPSNYLEQVCNLSSA